MRVAKSFDSGDPLFKGCTRPPMLFGVPLNPLIAVTAAVFLLSMWGTLLFGAAILFILMLFPIVMGMRIVTKLDDQKFRLLGLKFLFRVVNRNKNWRFWNASAYSPIIFKKRK